MTMWQTNRGLKTWWQRVYNGASGSAREAGNERNPIVARWSFGVLNPRNTTDVPGTVVLLTNATPTTASEGASDGGRKTTADGKIILEPQPDDSPNDPLNWPRWRRDGVLLSVGLYCMVGGGMTPILAAGFTNIAIDYNVSVPRVALTTGFFMTGLAVGCVIVSPTAILYGKRPLYLAGAVLFIATSIWCALSPNFISLVLARIFQGISVSPVEALPSATITEIFFLHERAFRIGIYALLLLGGKNLVPLVSAAIIERLGWRWVFWIVVMVAAFCGVLLFLFDPETFWDRKPASRLKGFSRRASRAKPTGGARDVALTLEEPNQKISKSQTVNPQVVSWKPLEAVDDPRATHTSLVDPSGPDSPEIVELGNWKQTTSRHGHSFQSATKSPGPQSPEVAELGIRERLQVTLDSGRYKGEQLEQGENAYTHHMKQLPAENFTDQLAPWHGRLREEPWLTTAVRPFKLFAYPAVLWSSAVYACSIGWLIVVSESLVVVFRNPETYNFSAFSAGLVYVSPFIGGILGTAIAGKASDAIVQAMARRNGGVYEPEFRLVMAIPVAITTVIGLMGFGWSAEVRDPWIVPTVFFGIISFGCSLGSTTAITFCVDSYCQYAAEALVTLNFSKNIFHGLIFSLFVTEWIESDGPKMVYAYLGVIQLVLMALTVPMFLFGKRARHWTARRM